MVTLLEKIPLQQRVENLLSIIISGEFDYLGKELVKREHGELRITSTLGNIQYVPLIR